MATIWARAVAGSPPGQRTGGLCPALVLVLLIGFFVGLPLALPGAAQAQALQAVPALTSRVVDPAGILDDGARARIDGKLAELERDKGAQVVFLLVATTAPEDIASYANRVGNAWKIGRRGVGDGVLLVVARDDRRVRIEVAKTLEGALPDLAARQVIDEAITPAFRRGDYAAGLEAAADRISALVRGEPLPAPQRREDGAPTDELSFMDLAIFLFVAVPVVAAVLRRLLGRKLGSLVTGGGVALVAALATSSLLIALLAGLVGAVLALLGVQPLGRQVGRRARHHAGWGGPMGGWAGGSGWGGSGGGGFSSGGGGDFGGGGASGDW